MVKPRVDPDPGSRLSTPGKLLLRLVTTPVFRLPTSGKLLLRLMTVKIFRLRSVDLNLLQIVAVGRYLPRLGKTLGQSPLKE